MRLLPWLFFALACKPDATDPNDSPPPDTNTDTDTDTDTIIDTSTLTTDTGSATTDTSTTATGDTGPTFTGDTGPVSPTIDCAAIPTSPLSFRKVPAARAYHGIVFTDTGTLIGSDGNSLIETDNYGNFSVFLPATGYLEQLDRFPDGTIVAAGDSRVVTISVAGAVTVIASVPNIYGVRVGPDGMIYTADWDRVLRIDPVNGTTTTLLSGAQLMPKVLDFNIDFTKLYIGTINNGGSVFEVDLDATYTPIGNPRLLASTPGSWHDGLAVDICGNLYVAEFNNRAMYRISPTGQVAELFANTVGYGHGVTFGSGLGGFSETALYIPQPYDNLEVSEVEIGVPYRTYTGPVINGP